MAQQAIVGIIVALVNTNKSLIPHLIVVLATLSWSDVASYFPSSNPVFASEPTAEIATRPLIIFLGMDERGVPSAALGTDKGNNDSSSDATTTSSNDQAAKTQKSLPKATDTGMTPDGNPYFVIDTTHHPELAQKALEQHGGDTKALFMDLRAELLCLDFDSTGVVAEARALVDWNKRSMCSLRSFFSYGHRSLTHVSCRPLLCWMW
jgi:hypothetical protein